MALFYAILNYRLRSFKNIVWLFCGFYGYNFVIAGKDGDVQRYKDQLVALYEANYTASQFFFMLIDGDYGRGDYMQPILTYAVSSFTDNYRILYLIYGLIFGYLLSRSLDILIRYSKGNTHYLIKFLLIYFFFLVPVWYINGVRYYLAVHFLVYGLLRFYVIKDKKSILYLIGSVLMHFSFIAPLAIIIIHYILPKNIVIYSVLLLISIFFVNLSIPEMVNFVPSTTHQLDSRVKGYTHEQVIELAENNKTKVIWFIKWHENLVKFIGYLMIGLFGLTYRKIKDKSIIALFTLGIFIFAFGNVVDKIPSMGRIYIISFMILTAAFILLSIDLKHRLFNRISFSILVPPSIFCILVSLRYSFDSMGLYTLLLNPMTSPFFEMTSNIRNLY